MDEVIRWAIIGGLAIVVFALFDWFISNGSSFEARRKLNEQPHALNPRTEDYVRSYIWEGPDKGQTGEFEKVEGSDADKAGQ